MKKSTTSSPRIHFLLAMALLLAPLAHATSTPITVPNASFGSPAIPFTTGSDTTVLPGWVFGNLQNGEHFGSESISSFFTSTAGSSGNNFAFIDNEDTVEAETITSAAPLAVITPLTTYTLSVAIGNVEAPDKGLYTEPGDVSFSLLANGVAFATDTIPNGTVTNGSWEDFTLSSTTPDAGSLIGEDLTIQLASLPQTNTGYMAAFNNVKLNADSEVVAATEPHGRKLAMVTLGALALCLIRRHQIG